jgi:hypothetical protein
MNQKDIAPAKFSGNHNDMHIPKLLAIVCVVSLGAGSLSVHAQRPDSDMQAVAREQMRKAMAELEKQSPATPTNAMPAPEKPKRAKKVVVQPPPAPPTMVIVPAAPKPVMQPPAAEPPPPATPAPAAVPPPATPPPAAASILEQPKPVAVVKKKAPPTKGTGFSAFAPIAESPNMENPPVTLVIPGDSPVMAPGKELKRADERKAREEVRKTLGETGPNNKSEAKFPVEAKMGPEHAATTMAKPAPAPGSKEERLSELLDLYKADRISPAEYHDQRAKIIAEP